MSSARDRWEKSFLAVCAAILLVGVSLRIAALFDSFWADEIASWAFARAVNSPLEILTNIHVDNNHYLNTFFLYILGDHRNWVIYRIPSLLFGVASVFLAGAIARRWGRCASVTAMVLFGVSHLMVLYSSEARGYASVVFFSLLSFTIVARYRAVPSWSAVCAFWGSIILGFLSHLTFGIVFVALFVWMIWDGKLAYRDALRWFGVPVLFLLFLFLFDVQYLASFTQKTPVPKLWGIRESITFPFGIRSELPFSFIFSVLAEVTIVAYGLFRLRWENDEQVFFLSMFLQPRGGDSFSQLLQTPRAG